MKRWRALRDKNDYEWRMILVLTGNKKTQQQLKNTNIRSFISWTFFTLNHSFRYLTLLLLSYVCTHALHWLSDINFHLSYERWLFFSSCVHTSLFNRPLFSLLMISSLFGNSTLWHRTEMSMFGWGRISVVLDLVGWFHRFSLFMPSYPQLPYNYTTMGYGLFSRVRDVSEQMN